MSGTPLRHAYAVYGGRLRSALAFDAVPATGTVPCDWTLDVAPLAALPADARLLGEATYAGGATMRLWRHASGLTLQTSDVGAYEVAGGGATLSWRAAARGRADVLARFDVLGRVLPLALHEAGLLCLHAGGVVLPAGAVALVAPKGHGKSTLALALARAGAPLLGDDVVPVDASANAPLARPGVHAARLWPDSAARLGAARAAVDEGDRKVHLHALPAVQRAEAPAPLVAVYLLEPASAHAPRAAERERISVRDAALALVAHATNGRLLGGAEAAAVLARATDVARRVRAYRLRVARDFTRLDEVVATLAGWHDGAPVEACA